MAGALPRGSADPRAARGAAHQGAGRADAVGDAGRPKGRERRADPHPALEKMFQQMEGSPELVQLVEEAGPGEIAVSEEQASQRPIVRLVDLIISEAILARSSDIHIEPEEGGVAVRYRIDGVLRQQMKI